MCARTFSSFSRGKVGNSDAGALVVFQFMKARAETIRRFSPRHRHAGGGDLNELGRLLSRQRRPDVLGFCPSLEVALKPTTLFGDSMSFAKNSSRMRRATSSGMSANSA